MWSVNMCRVGFKPKFGLFDDITPLSLQKKKGGGGGCRKAIRGGDVCMLKKINTGDTCTGSYIGHHQDVAHTHTHARGNGGEREREKEREGKGQSRRTES